jgi:hypothetical protein
LAVILWIRLQLSSKAFKPVAGRRVRAATRRPGGMISTITSSSGSPFGNGFVSSTNARNIR